MSRLFPLAWAVLGLAAGNALAQSADSLPAFRPDSAVQAPFRQAEAGPSPWSAGPADSSARPKTARDSQALADTVADRLRRRHPAVSVYLGVDFSDLDAKDAFNTALSARLNSDTSLHLRALQGYESVHLAFPVGLQALYPVAGYLDLVAKTHSYWYKQTAILGDSASRHVGDEWYAVQANLGGLGLRFYVPPPFLSISDGLGLWVQGLLYWNLGQSQIYTPYGAATARFRPLGSGYEFLFGMQQALSGPWKITGAIGFLHQDFASRNAWSDIIRYAPPAGRASWSSSSLQASLNLWYHFGVPAPAPEPAAAADSTRRF